MNGKLSMWTVAKALEAKAKETENLYRDTYGEREFTADEIVTMFNYVRDELVKQANVDLNAVAVEVLTANNYALTGSKIQAIKEVRIKTSSGLKEAKDAVEAMLPTVLLAQAEQVLKALAEANSRTGWDNYRRVIAYEHSDAINY